MREEKEAAGIASLSCSFVDLVIAACFSVGLLLSSSSIMESRKLSRLLFLDANFSRRLDRLLLRSEDLDSDELLASMALHDWFMRLATLIEAGERAVEVMILVDRFITAMAAALMLLLFFSECRWDLVLRIPCGVDVLAVVASSKVGKEGIVLVRSLLRLRDLHLDPDASGVRECEVREDGDPSVDANRRDDLDLDFDLGLPSPAGFLLDREGECTSFVDANRRRDDLDFDLGLPWPVELPVGRDQDISRVISRARCDLVESDFISLSGEVERFRAISLDISRVR